MATPSAADRANRRSSAAAARRAAPVDVPDVLAEIVDSPEENFVASESDVSPTPAPPTQGGPNLSLQRDATASRPTSSVALPMVEEDLSRTVLPGDLIMPKLKISQGLSAVNRRFTETRGKEGVPMGSWYHSTNGKDLGDTIYFIPVDMRKSRSRFIQGQGIVCRSFDLTHGEGDPGIECEGTLEERRSGIPEGERGCAYRLWTRDGTKNTPPPCGVTFNFPGLIIDNFEGDEKPVIMTAMLQLRSTNTPAANEIITNVIQMGEGVWKSIVLELTVNERTNTRGTFYTAKAEFFDHTANLPALVQRRAEAFAKQMGSVDLRMSIETDDLD